MTNAKVYVLTPTRATHAKNVCSHHGAILKGILDKSLHQMAYMNVNLLVHKHMTSKSISKAL